MISALPAARDRCGPAGARRASALALAREGVSLTIVARNKDYLEQRRREIHPRRTGVG